MTERISLKRQLIIGGAGLLSLMATTGCTRNAPAVAATPPPTVTISQPLEHPVTDHEQFTGRTEAVESVDLQPRVTGYLDKVHFKPGQVVKAGDLLFEIDPRPYKAELDRANGQVLLRQAGLQLAIAENNRGKNIAATDPGAISKQDLDKFAAQEAEADAEVKAATANAESAKLNLEFAKIFAPISGKISKSSIDPGNLVTTNMTVLANIVSVDPMYATFDADERTVLLVQQRIREGKIEALANSEIPIFLGLANDSDYPHEGRLDYVENRVDPNTGTLRLRAEFPNPKQILSPGLFAKIKLPIGKPRQSLLVNERALGTDQGQKFAYVVNAEKKVEYRPVKVGLLEGGLRVIEEGLKPGEWVVVNGLQRVRPGVTVDAQKTEMSGAAGGQKAPAVTTSVKETESAKQ